MDAETHELIAAYALDALDDPVERERAEVLLATSEEARAELRSLSDTAAALTVATAGPVPGVALRDRILAGARAEPQNVIPLEGRIERRGRTIRLLAAAAGIAAAAAVGLGIWVAALSAELGDARTALKGARATAALLADPAAETVALAAGDGELVVTPDGRAVLIVDGLPSAPSGATYQVWLVDDGEATSAGLFTATGGVDVVPIEGAVQTGTVVAVTLEEAGGADQPTGEPLLSSTRV